MTWWQAVLSTLGVVAFFPAFVLVGNRVDLWFQNRMDAKLRGGETVR